MSALPTRVIREGIINSDRVNELDWAAEVFYRRLLNKVDDHGLFDARPSVLRTSLYPLKVDRVREADCSRWIAECEKAGLIVLYEAGGKPYLKVLDTRWPTRSEPKFPKPPRAPAGSREQLHATVPVVVVGVVGEDVGGEKLLLEAPPGGLNGHDPVGEIVERIPLCDGSEFPVPKAMLTELDRLYPAVDPVQTLREIRGWNLANPRRRKTKRGIGRHIFDWFQREQDKQSRRSS